MKNFERLSFTNGCLINELQTINCLSSIQKKTAKPSKTAVALYTMLMLFFVALLLQPFVSFSQPRHTVLKKAQAKKIKHKKKVLDVLTLRKKEMEDDDAEGEDGAQQRLEYEFNRTKDPATGMVPQYKLITAYTKHQQSVAQQKMALQAITNGIGPITNSTTSPIQTTPWIERGPSSSSAPSYDNNPSTSGRSDAFWVDIDASKPNQVFVGGNNGGLWTCADITLATPAWTFIDNFANIAISSICQDPTNTNIMYFGTGEKLARVLGGGIWKSTDHGVTWSFLSNTTSFYNVSKVLCDKHGYLYVGMVQYVETGSNFTNGGVMRSTDGGTTWTDITPSVNGINSRQVSDMVYDASIDRMGVYLGYQYTGETQGYCYSTPSTVGVSTTWSTPTSAATGLGLYATLNNQSLRIRQTELCAKGGVVWALQGYSGSTNGLNGGNYTNLYLSTDGGVTWTLKQNITSAFFDAGQNWYALGIDCDPQNPSTNVVIGGLNPFKSSDGGASITQVARWVGSTQAGPNTAAQFVHADIHNIYYNTNASGLNRVVCMDDGGINYSADGGTTWVDKNVGLRTVEFYSCALNPSDPNYYLAGAQDNGSHQLTKDGLGTSYQVSGGDGAFSAIDQLNPNNQFTAYVYNQYYVATDKGVNLANSFIGTAIDQTGQFINPFDFDAKTKKLYASTTGGQYLRWDDPLTTKNTYPKITVPAIGSNVITAITVSPNLSNTIYLAAGSVVVKATNANTASPTFTTITPSTVTAGSNISSIVLGPSTTDQDIIVTSSSYGTNKVFLSANGGGTWTNITGNLPDMPVNWAMFYPGSNSQIYLATNLGVWYTTAVSGSTNWQADITIPKVSSRMIKYSGSTNTIALATYGRGLWTAKISTVPKVSFYPAMFSTSKSFSNTTANCRSYYDYSDSLQISDPPTGAATATLSVQAGGTATLGADFDFTTNGSFTSPSNTITFSSGTYPNKIPFTIRVYNNKNKNAVLPLTANFNIAISGTTDAQTSLANQNLLISLSDSLVAIPTTTTANQTIWTENWDAWPSNQNFWVFSPDLSTSPISKALFYPTTVGSCSNQNISNIDVQLFSTNASGSLAFCGGGGTTNVPVFYRAISANTDFYANMKVTFDYISLSGTTTNKLVYSVDNGVNWVTIQSYPAHALATVTVAIPTVLNNTNFLLGWSSAAGSSGFAIDNISFVADITPPAIETTVSSASNYYVNSGTNIDAYSTNNKIMANITNPSADLGCVTASIENAGNTWQSYLGGNRSQKTFLVTPATNASGTTYKATFYFTNAELAGLTPANLKLAKTEAASLALSTSANTVAVTPTTVAYNTTGISFTGSFTGFSRYFLIDQNVVLPISLVTFTGSLVANNTVLDWITSSETNNKEFDVQWSTDGINFTTVGIVPSQGNSTTNVGYSYTHNHPTGGVNYYRLKQIDKDGTASFSAIITIVVNSGNSKPFLYPIPAKNSITLNFGTIVQQATVNLYSSDMKLIQKLTIGQATATKDIDITKLPAGIYFLRIITGTNTETLQFIKE